MTNNESRTADQEVSPEQRARELLMRMHDCHYYNDPQRLSAGDVVELANLFAECNRLREREKTLLDSHTGCGCGPNCAVCQEKGYT